MDKDWLKGILERLENKVDALSENQQKHAAEMKTYVERTNNQGEDIKTLDKRLTPVERHMLKVQGVIGLFKWVGAAGTLAAIAGAAKYFGVV